MLKLPRIPFAMAAVLTCASFAMAANPQTPIRISSEVAQSLVIDAPQPQYPPKAKIAHVEGDVVLVVRISKQGTIEDARGVSGHSILIGVALDAVRRWRYKPYTLNGSPVEVETTITLEFRLQGAEVRTLNGPPKSN